MILTVVAAFGERRGSGRGFRFVLEIKSVCGVYTLFIRLSGGCRLRVKASIKADPSKGDKIVRRQGRIYIINKKDPNRKQRQKGPARKR